ncbi:hypothetical protein, conserved [Babesia ovata]|uniref:Uncharacterized protein n=1 Tax=Babesia ovata TaxID=189622 RepID=A0A2H6KFD1_9APIC|nr:uncharacterized protein BOVATA_031880 [Babesia ovata]GBE61695.1 hypothetical protein, conserved [Babesia ovata]
MDELGYEWYTGFKTPRAVGQTVKEALELFRQETDRAQNQPELTSTAHKKPAMSAIEFSGIAVEVSHEDQMDIIDLANKGIEKWLPLCVNHAAKSQPNSPCNGGESEKHEPDECEVSTIKLQSSHHVTLFYYSTRDAKPEMEDPRTEAVFQEMHDLSPYLRELRCALTPYEFSVALLYRHFYGLTMPGEESQPQSGNHSSREFSQYVPITLKHVVFVPGVLMCATAQLHRELVALPSPDGTFGPYCSYPHGKVTTMEDLTTRCWDEGAVMLEENHCTHVTLGVTKQYKPVVSNNICDGIRRYLDFLKKYEDANEDEKLWRIKRVNEDDSVDEVRPEELLKILEVYGSRPSEFKHAKREFVQLAPHAARRDEMGLEHAAGEAVFDLALPPKDECAEKQIERYKRTVCFIADGGKWIYIRNLPIRRNLQGPDDETQGAWLVDSYISTLDKPVMGEIRFYKREGHEPRPHPTPSST